jgi:hypothetical protein
MTFEEIEKLAGIVQSAVTTLALVIGAGWAIRKYIIRREEVWNLKLRYEYEVRPFTERYDLLLLYLHAENIGNIVIRIGKKGCVVTVREIPRSADRPHMLRPDQERPPLLEEEIINSRGTAKYIRYEIEPGASYKHTIPLVLPRGILLEVRAVFWWKNDEEATSARAIIDLAPNVPRREPGAVKRYFAWLLGGSSSSGL